jgi:uncharacterized repeat protein (TIGR03803 family)
MFSKAARSGLVTVPKAICVYRTILFIFAAYATEAAASAGAHPVVPRSVRTVTAAQRMELPSKLSPAGTAFKTIYLFGEKAADGANPVASLFLARGQLLGTTQNGGANGSGTIFEVTPSGLENVLHSFGGTAMGDGSQPLGSLIDLTGTLYGTTEMGGTSNLGTVFAINAANHERIVYNFKVGTAGKRDGRHPFAGLVNLSGTFYGTTMSGGNYGQGGYGTVFAVSTNGTEKVLHSFGNGSDGAAPLAGLLAVDGDLFGTTSGGGISGNGTVFEISTSGTETVVYNFKVGTAAAADGSGPVAGLLNVNGNLYGTTEFGGKYSRGTVFELVKSAMGKWKETVIYNFGSPALMADGINPVATLTYLNGELYGTTLNGIATGGETPPLGTVFEVNPATGKERVLYFFQAGSGGANPSAGLVNLNGGLFGTTQLGGLLGTAISNNGNGTVYVVAP